MLQHVTYSCACARVPSTVMDRQKLPDLFSLRSSPERGEKNTTTSHSENTARSLAKVAKTSRGCKPTVLCGGKFATGHVGVIQSDSTSKDSTSKDSTSKVTFTDANDRQAAGEITMDSSGALGLKDHGGGEVFMKIPQGIIGDNEGVYFSLQSTTNTDLYLALNSDFSVKGLSKQSMGDFSNSYWRYLTYDNIKGKRSDDGSGYIVLQYWGKKFGPDPNQAPYYFIIEMDEKRVPEFKIGRREDALLYGRLGYRVPS